MRTVLIAALILVAAALSFGQTPSAEKPSKDTGRLKIDAGPLVYRGNVLLLTGKKNKQVAIEQLDQNYKILANRVEITQEPERDTAEITGNLKFTNPDTTVTSSSASADFGESKIVFKGEVKIISRQKEPKAEEPPKAKPNGNGQTTTASGTTTASAGATDSKAPEPAKNGTANGKAAQPRKPTKTTITCEQFEFDYDERVGIATGNLKITQEERSATAERAIFDDAKNIITLEGKVEMEEIKDKKPRKLRCAQIIINVDEDTWTTSEDGTEADVTFKMKKKAKSKAPEAKAGESKAPESKAAEGKPGS